MEWSIAAPFSISPKRREGRHGFVYLDMCERDVCDNQDVLSTADLHMEQDATKACSLRKNLTFRLVLHTSFGDAASLITRLEVTLTRYVVPMDAQQKGNT